MMSRASLLPFITLVVLSCNQDHKQVTATDDSTQAAVSSPKQDTLLEPISASKNQPNEDQLIVPGEKVGKTLLGMNADGIEQLLGKPDMSDAAMGKAWLIWYGKRDEHNNKTELDIYTTYKDSSMREKTIQQIRVTSSYFKTQDGLGVYSGERDIRKVFSGLKPAMTYTDGGRTIHVLDDVQKGIAFEVTRVDKDSICVGVIAHLPGKAVANTYVYLHPDTKIVD